MRARAVQSGPEMAPKTKQIVVRLEEELAQRIEAYRAKLHEETGLDVSHAAAVRLLLVGGLDALGKSRKGRG